MRYACRNGRPVADTIGSMRRESTDTDAGLKRLITGGARPDTTVLGGVNAVARALAILTAFDADELWLPLAELARRASDLQRSSVSTATPISRATASIAALSGGSNRATALSLNACPYLANSLFHHRPPFLGSIGATTILTWGGPLS